MESHVLYNDGHHKCIAFSMPAEDESVPSNQFLIIDGKEAAIIDPGGDLTFTPLTLQITKFTSMDNIKYVIGSHQDPDILASMPRWLIHLQNTNRLCGSDFCPIIILPLPKDDCTMDSQNV